MTDSASDSEELSAKDAAAIVDALHTVEELLSGLDDPRAEIRFRAIPRLRARWGDDPRTVSRLIRALAEDPEGMVRDGAAMNLYELAGDKIKPALEAALDDPDRAVRWSAQYGLWQSGRSETPPDNTLLD